MDCSAGLGAVITSLGKLGNRSALPAAKMASPTTSRTSSVRSDSEGRRRVSSGFGEGSDCTDLHDYATALDGWVTSGNERGRSAARGIGARFGTGGGAGSAVGRSAECRGAAAAARRVGSGVRPKRLSLIDTENRIAAQHEHSEPR